MLEVDAAAYSLRGPAAYGHRRDAPAMIVHAVRLASVLQLQHLHVHLFLECIQILLQFCCLVEVPLDPLILLNALCSSLFFFLSLHGCQIGAQCRHHSRARFSSWGSQTISPMGVHGALFGIGIVLIDLCIALGIGMSPL